MSGATFKSIFEGKESRLESHLNVDEGLLRKLEEYQIITNLQRRKIKVSLLLFASFNRIRRHKLQLCVTR